MNSFDKNTKILILGDKPLDNIIDEYRDSAQYISYRRYLDYGLKEDVKNVLIPTLNEILEDRNVLLSYDNNNDSLLISNGHNNSNQKIKQVRLSLIHDNAMVFEKRVDNDQFAVRKPKKLSPFTLLELPYMDRSGILYYRDKTYVVLNSLSMDNGLSLDKNKLKIVDNEHSMEISKPISPYITIFKDKVNLIDLVIMLAKRYYGDSLGSEYSYDFIKSIRNANFISSISGTEEDYKMSKLLNDSVGDVVDNTIELIMDNMVGISNDLKADNFKLEDKIEAGIFNSEMTRHILNDMLSLKNALGKILSRDVVTKDGTVIAKEGERVTNNLLDKFNKYFIDTIYVRKKLNIVNQYLGELVAIDFIPIGAPLIKEFIDLKGNELQGYDIAPKSYILNEDILSSIDLDSLGPYEIIPDSSIVLPTGTLIREDILNYLEATNTKEIRYKRNPKSAKIMKAYFEEEYISNRHFKINGETKFVDLLGDVYQQSDLFTCHDMLALLSLYMKLCAGEHIDIISNVDIGLRKKVNQVYDYFHKAFIKSCEKFKKSKSLKLKSLISIGDTKNLDNSDTMSTLFKYFSEDFYKHLRTDMKVLDMLDCSNPVASISSLTRINSIVKNADSIADSMRRLTTGHYGRICPYETPQSKKLGVVNNLANSCVIENGIMYNYYYKLEHIGGKIIVGKDKIKMDVIEEEKYRISDISLIEFNSNREVTSKGKVLARVPSNDSIEKMTVASIDIEDVQYVSTSPNQHCSIACTTVPFAGADDAARVSFGLSMVKQTKGLVKGEIPLVCTTGFFNIPNMNTFYKIFAEEDGSVLYVSNKSITVRYTNTGKVVTYDFESITLAPKSIILRTPIVSTREHFKKGDTLVTSNFINNGIMATGVNALVAYMTDGYNYEDGVPCSRRLSRKLLSYGVHKDIFKVSKKYIGIDLSNIDYKTYISKGDKLAISRAIKSSSNIKKYTILPANRCRGYICNETIIKDKKNSSIAKEIEIKSVSFDELTVSDKVCNRHGNKGVVCQVHENSDMPYLNNGEFIDIKYNPNGIVSRMNIGQMLEASLGLVCYVLDIIVLCDAFNSPSTKVIKMLLAYTSRLANEDDIEAVFADYPTLPKSLHDYCRENIDNIRKWRNTFNEEGKAYLIDPKSGKRSLSRVNIGVNYIYKLVQEGEDKLHSRGGYLTSDYVEKTESPTKGSSKGGGQKMGYMELDALAAYGASNLLKEITNERGDNYIARNNLTVKAVHSGNTRYCLDERYGIRRSSEYMFELLKSAGLNLSFTEDELDLNHPEERKYYKKDIIKRADLDDRDIEQETSNIISSYFKDMFNNNK